MTGPSTPRLIKASVVDTPIPNEAIEALEDLYQSVDHLVLEHSPTCQRDGHCCRFKTSGLRLFASTLEAAYLLQRANKPGFPAEPGACPYLEGDSCRARDGRTLGCRLHFCDPQKGEVMEALYEGFHQKIVQLHEQYGVDYLYQELMSFLDPKKE